MPGCGGTTNRKSRFCYPKSLKPRTGQLEVTNETLQLDPELRKSFGKDEGNCLILFYVQQDRVLQCSLRGKNLDPDQGCSARNI